MSKTLDKIVARIPNRARRRTDDTFPASFNSGTGKWYATGKRGKNRETQESTAEYERADSEGNMSGERLWMTEEEAKRGKGGHDRALRLDRALAAVPDRRARDDRDPNQSDLDAAARGLRMTGMSPSELDDLSKEHENKPLFASRVIFLAARQMAAAKRRMGHRDAALRRDKHHRALDAILARIPDKRRARIRDALHGRSFFRLVPPITRRHGALVGGILQRYIMKKLTREQAKKELFEMGIRPDRIDQMLGEADIRRAEVNEGHPAKDAAIDRALRTIPDHRRPARRAADRLRRGLGLDSILSKSDAREILREYHAGSKKRLQDLARELKLDERAALAWVLTEAESGKDRARSRDADYSDFDSWARAVLGKYPSAKIHQERLSTGGWAKIAMVGNDVVGKYASSMAKVPGGWIKDAVWSRDSSYLVTAKFTERDAGARIIYNKLLGGWYVVTGPHQTPLNGRFNSKEEAQQWLETRGKGRDADPGMALFNVEVIGEGGKLLKREQRSGKSAQLVKELYESLWPNAKEVKVWYAVDRARDSSYLVTAKFTDNSTFRQIYEDVAQAEEKYAQLEDDPKVEDCDIEIYEATPEGVVAGDAPSFIQVLNNPEWKSLVEAIEDTLASLQNYPGGEPTLQRVLKQQIENLYQKSGYRYQVRDGKRRGAVDLALRGIPDHRRAGSALDAALRAIPDRRRRVVVDADARIVKGKFQGQEGFWFEIDNKQYGPFSSAAAAKGAAERFGHRVVSGADRSLDRRRRGIYDDFKVGDIVKFEMPLPNGKTIIKGRVTLVKPDGRLEVKMQTPGMYQGGYHVIDPGSVTAA